MTKTILAAFLSAILVSSCTTNPPLDEYALARTAVEAAKDKESARYAPAYFHRAEEAYREAEEFYNDQDYDKAEEKFRESRTFAERAENAARLQKYKSGDVPQ